MFVALAPSDVVPALPLPARMRKETRFLVYPGEGLEAARNSLPCTGTTLFRAILAMAEDFDVEDELHFFAEPYLYEPEWTEEELRQQDGCHGCHR